MFFRSPTISSIKKKVYCLIIWWTYKEKKKYFVLTYTFDIWCEMLYHIFLREIKLLYFEFPLKWETVKKTFLQTRTSIVFFTAQIEFECTEVHFTSPYLPFTSPFLWCVYGFLNWVFWPALVCIPTANNNTQSEGQKSIQKWSDWKIMLFPFLLCSVLILVVHSSLSGLCLECLISNWKYFIPRMCIKIELRRGVQLTAKGMTFRFIHLIIVLSF